MTRAYYIFLVIIAILAGIACTQGGALILTILILPLGLLTIAAPTILLYDLVFLPMVLRRNEGKATKYWVLATLAVAAAVATLPGLLTEQAARDFAQRAEAQDFDRPMASKPRSIELIGDASSGMWVHGHSVGDKAARCNEVCTRLLMNGEVDWIRMTDVTVRGRSRTPQSVVYRFEHRDVCPDLAADHGVEQVLRDRLVASDCLISEPDRGLSPDASVNLTTRYEEQRPSDIEPPKFVDVRSVKTLEIESKRDGAMVPVLRRTETVARPLALPFYFGAKMDMQCGNCNGPTIGRDTVTRQPIDLAQSLHQSLGYELAAISPAQTAAPRQTSEAILGLSKEQAPSFSRQQQDVLKEAVQAIAKKEKPSDADADFIRRVVADDRVSEAVIGISVQNMARRNPDWLESLVPVILDRMAVPVDQQVGHYKSSLGWSLQNLPVAKLEPYRDRIVDIVRKQPDWTTTGLLVRLVELGGDQAIGLVLRELDARPKTGATQQQQFAAVAICRGDADAWQSLEPVVLAHLSSGQSAKRFGDADAALLLALVRFGEKTKAVDIVKGRGPSDEANVIVRLNKLDEDFDAKHCRDML
jgi:hypothetical protein